MSDAGDEIKVDETAQEVEAVVSEPPKGKMSVEDALQVCQAAIRCRRFVIDAWACSRHLASPEERPRTRRSCSRAA